MTEQLEIEVAKLGQEVKDLSARVERGFFEIKDSTINRIINLECNKAEKDEVEKIQKILNDNHEVRIRKVENGLVWVFAFSSGAGAIIGILVDYFFKIR
jgi:hypothetical protein